MPGTRPLWATFWMALDTAQRISMLDDSGDRPWEEIGMSEELFFQHSRMYWIYEYPTFWGEKCCKECWDADRKVANSRYAQIVTGQNLLIEGSLCLGPY